MAERFIGWFCLDMPATLENLFSCRRVEPFATGETRRMAGSCNSFCQALSSKYISGADGKWYSISTGKGYAPQDIPNNTGDTYVASKRLLSK